MSTDDPLVQAVAKLIARHHNPQIPVSVWTETAANELADEIRPYLRMHEEWELTRQLGADA